jgi:hypothetical protein
MDIFECEALRFAVFATSKDNLHCETQKTTCTFFFTKNIILIETSGRKRNYIVSFDCDGIVQQL